MDQVERNKYSILHVLAMDEVGGAENHVNRFIEATHPRIQHDILVVNEKIHSTYQQALSDWCDIIHWKYSWGVKLPSFLRAATLRRSLKNRSYTAVFCYSQMTKPGLISTLKEETRNNLIYYDEGATWDHGREKASLLNLYDQHIAASTGSAMMLEKKFGIESGLIHTIPNAMPESHFESIDATSVPPTTELSTDEPFPDDVDQKKLKVLYLGRLTHQKGIHVLIRAISLLSDDFHLTIVGDGVRMPRLKELAHEMEVKDRVIFAGFQSEPAPYLKWADVMVVPSIREPFGLVIQEAGAAGLPVIASNIDGIPDMIDQDESGVLIEPSVPVDRWPEEVEGYDVPDRVVNRATGELMPPKLIDPEQIASKLEFLGEHPQKAREMGINLQDKIRRKLLLPAVLGQYDQILEDLSE